MIDAPIPVDDEKRLRVLRELGILDAQADDWLDRVTSYCRSRFSVPICLISLVDEDRQWFMSASGLDAKETPRDVSFCGHVVASRGQLVVPDALIDERFRDNPLVTGAPWIRFYAGCPLVVQGQAIGAICIIDQVARRIEATDLEELEELAGAIAWHISHRGDDYVIEFVKDQGTGGALVAAGACALPADAASCEPTSDPWKLAVEYIGAHPNTLEATMLGGVIFPVRGFDLEDGSHGWRVSDLEPAAVAIARRIVAVRSGRGAIEPSGGEG